jgi:hypothetical protein
MQFTTRPEIRGTFGMAASAHRLAPQVAMRVLEHGAILGLGLHSSINAPVLSEGGCVGVLNFLMASDRVSPQQLSADCAFALQPAVVAALIAIPRREPHLTGAK